jgi:tetrahydromethanopterin S-methyltransferase subunit G
MEQGKTTEAQEKSGWGSGILVGLLIGVALFVVTYVLLLAAK